MVFLGLTKPNPASRRVAMDHGAQRGYNYPEPHVGATRAPPHAPTHDGTDDVKWRVTDGPCASMPYARDVNFVRVGAGAGDYAKAKGMMRRWSHFQLGWSEVTPDTGVEPGNLVCVCANVLGVWIRNPLRVVYRAEESKPARNGTKGSKPGSCSRTDASRGTYWRAKSRSWWKEGTTTRCGTAFGHFPGRRIRSRS